MTNKKYYLWIVFLAVVVVYGVIHAGYSIENNDSGFILGLSWQVFYTEGMINRLYHEITYVRPPFSVVLHQLAFLFEASVYLSRWVFYVQVALYSWLSVVIFHDVIKKTTANRLSTAWLVVLTALVFMLSVHNFPAMAWHTTDGIFFSVLAVYAVRFINVEATHIWPLVLAALFSLLAFLSKQSFYLIPFFIFVYIFVTYKPRLALLYMVIWFSLLAIFYAYLYWHASLSNYLSMTSGKTKVVDLLHAGVIDYAYNIFRYWWFFILLVFLFFVKNSLKSWYFNIILLIFILFFVYDRYELGNIFDVAFVLTALVSLYASFNQKAPQLYRLMLLLHAIAWSAAISWGYSTTLLYAAPVVLTVFATFVLWARTEEKAKLVYAAYLLLMLSFSVFYWGYGYPYNIEYLAQRSAMQYDMGALSPKLSYIKSDQISYEQHAELIALHKQYPVFSVLPAMTLAHIITETQNPIGIDWVMNSEVHDLSLLKTLALERRPTFFVLRGAKPDIHSQTKERSDFSLWVIEQSQLIDSGKYFDVYQLREQAQ